MYTRSSAFIVLAVFSYFLYSWCSSIWGLADGEESLIPGYLIPRETKKLPGSMSLIWKQISVSHIPFCLILWGSCCVGMLSPYPNHPKTSYWTTRVHSSSPEPAKIIQTIQLPVGQVENTEGQTIFIFNWLFRTFYRQLKSHENIK